jgi:hypothetical protein
MHLYCSITSTCSSVDRIFLLTRVPGYVVRQRFPVTRVMAADVSGFDVER